MQKGKRFSSLFTMSFVIILLALTTWQCREDDFKGEIIGVCPEVILTTPVNGDINVSTNKLISATFNEKMNGLTINTSTFFLKQGVNLISGSVTYFDSTAVFVPKFLLAANTVYTATITRGVKDLHGNIPVADTTWSFNTGSIPIVAVTSPHNGDVDVVLSKLITVDFSTAMDPASINESTFFVKKGLVSVGGGVSYVKQQVSAILGKVTTNGLRATFTPTGGLEPNKVYSVTISKTVKDLAGNAMENDTTFSFSTGILPIVVVSTPADAAIDVVLGSQVTAIFSKAMNAATLNASTFTLKQGAVNILGVVNYTGMTVTFTPTFNLLPSTEYTATVTTGAKDMVGNSLEADYVWNFTTLTPTIQYAATLSSNLPESGTTNGSGVFNAGSSVTVRANANPGFKFQNWTENGSEVSSSANYTFSINNNRTLVANFEIIVFGPLSVNLGSAGDFAVLGGSGVSNIGVGTLITGDVGSFPTATSNGLLAGNVVGTLYTVASPVVGTAKTDLTAAYNDAQGRSLNAISLPGQLGGLTLAPGLYVNSTTSGISGTGANAFLTLDAGGNPNATWIFKMGSTLVTGSGTSVVLAGGAQAKNIYWSVGTSATLGTNSIFFGNILADQSITLTTGATLTGRALTRIGAITLDSNVVIKP